MVAEISSTEVARRLSDPTDRLLLLDVREDWERLQAVIEPSAHIPMQQLAGRLGEIPRDRPIVVYCHSGARSAMVAGYLATHGYPDVANLSGGIDAWSRLVDPQVPRY